MPITGFVSGCLAQTTISATQLLLDAISPASSVAFSSRKLTAAYAGSALRVRRSSDQAEQDIGFTGINLLDTSALTSFVGGGNGFVTKWYDQSGNGLDITNATAAKQPQIVASGVVKVMNGNPALLFIAANVTELLNAATLTSFLTVSAWTCVCNMNLTSFSGNANPEIDGLLVGDNLGFWSGCFTNNVNKIGTNQFDGVDRTISVSSNSTGTNYLHFSKYNGTSIFGYLNGGSGNSTASGNISNTTGVLAVGQTGAGDPFDGLCSEVVLFKTALASADLNTLGNGLIAGGGNMASYAGVSWSNIP